MTEQNIHRTHLHHYRKSALFKCIIPLLLHKISPVHVDDKSNNINTTPKIILQANQNNNNINNLPQISSTQSNSKSSNQNHKQHINNHSFSNFKNNNKFTKKPSLLPKTFRWGYKNHKNNKALKYHNNKNNFRNLTLRAMRARKKYPRKKLLHLSDTTGVCSVFDSERRDCGWPGIKRWQCRKKGCCFDPSSQNTIWCFSPERPRSCNKNTEFSCTTGQCIPLNQKCDGFIQCSDASDEQLCGWSSWEAWSDCLTGANDERVRKRMCKSSVYAKV